MLHQRMNLRNPWHTGNRSAGLLLEEFIAGSQEVSRCFTSDELEESIQ